MNAVDGSDHFTQGSDELPPSLLNIVLDTNPYAWAHLAPTLPLDRAIANLLVFINSHLAFNNANKVCIIASHLQQAEFLYPPAPAASITGKRTARSNGAPNGVDVEMVDGAGAEQLERSTNGAGRGSASAVEGELDTHLQDPSFYRPFAAISAALTKSLSGLLRTTLPTAASLSGNPTTSLAGALTLALTYTNKQSALAGPLGDGGTGGSSGEGSTGHINPSTGAVVSTGARPLISRIVVLSASPASPAQYIPLMNAIFAAQRLRIPVDVLALTPLASAFLQQAADATGGTYLPLAHPHGLLQTLMQAYLPSPPSRAVLVSPGQVDVDFRAACFCHRRVVDVGFVCSICLSIFCEPPEDAICLTCASHLAVNPAWGRPPAVLVRRRKKKRPRDDGDGTDRSSRLGTPMSAGGR